MDFIKKNKTYLIICSGFFFTGITAILFGMFYNSIYSNIVMDIAKDLNNGAPIERYQFMMQALFNGAEIEPMSRFVRISLSSTGVLLVYFSFYIWLNKESEDGFGAFFTRKYWFTFFLFRKEKVILSESTQKAIAAAERLVQQRNRQNLADFADHKTNNSKKKKAIEAIIRKD
jgi:hypothetical protein